MRAPVVSGVATSLTLAFIILLSLPGLDDSTVLAISDLGQLAAAGGACAACAWAALSSRRNQRRAWGLLAVGTGGWAAGQLVWTWYELVLGREVPFPSLADVGFLIFPVVAAAGLSSWLGAHSPGAARGRDLLDGAIIAGSLLILSWATALGSVVAVGGESWLAVTLSLAYPIGDVILGTLVLLALARGRADDTVALTLLAGGLGGLAVADSAYVYLVNTGSYSSDDLVSAGWLAGFLFVAAGALAGPEPRSVRVTRRHVKPRPSMVPARARMMLPYLPLVAAGFATCLRLLNAPGTPRFDLALGVVLIALVLARQFLAMSENQRLLIELGVVRDQLQHQALHDPLTGLANRALFADRVEHALSQPEADVSVLFCDLDDFKVVNDEFGHETGDTLLCVVAQRLVRSVRPSDTVARLGGDEFAVLLEHSDDALRVAERVEESVRQPYRIGDLTVRASMSVGSARYARASAAAPAGTSPETIAAALLKQADAAMYAAKAGRKGEVVPILGNGVGGVGMARLDAVATAFEPKPTA
jgi:diguanylate cyclase (GGDEF)-like protein